MEREVVGTVVVDDKEYSISSPSAMQVLKVAKFVSKRLLAAQQTLKFEMAIEKPDAMFLVLALLDALNEEDLVELAVMLLQSDTKKTRALVDKHLELLWLSEAFKLWVQATQLGLVLANFFQGFAGLADSLPKELVETPETQTPKEP